MGIFDRLSSLLRSNINDLISRAEDPEKMLTQILADMRSQLAKAKQQVASAIADEKRLRDQADTEFKQAEDWERRAMLAVQEGRDDLAKQALVRQAEHANNGQQLQQTWETHRLETEKLKNSLRDLNDKIEEAIRRGRAFLDEGAALVFVPGAHQREVVERLVEGLGVGKLSVIGLPGALPAAEYEALGVARISYGPLTQRVALRALKDLAASLYAGGVVAEDTPALN